MMALALTHITGCLTQSMDFVTEETFFANHPDYVQTCCDMRTLMHGKSHSGYMALLFLVRMTTPLPMRTESIWARHDGVFETLFLFQNMVAV